MLTLVLLAASLTLIVVTPVVALAICKVTKEFKEDKHDR